MKRTFPALPHRVVASGLAALGAWACGLAAAEGLPGGLADCLDEAMRSNPRIQAAQAGAGAAHWDAETVRLVFRAPSFSASAGQVESPSDVPFGTMPFTVPDDALSAQAGVETPLAAGVYGGAGIRQLRYRTDDDSDGDSLTSAGARLRIPLWHDRGFRENLLEVESLSAAARAEAAAARAVVLDELAGVASSYALLLFRAADAAEVRHALERAEALERETSDRASLQDVAEYQVFPARYEAATRREELAGAEGRIATALDDLSGAVGVPVDPAGFGGGLEAAGETLGEWARAAAGADHAAELAADAAESCPEVLAARESARSKAESASSAAEAGKPNLDVLLGVGWGSEEDDASGRAAGYGAAIVLSAPLSRDGVRARAEAASARAEAARAAAASAEFSARVRHGKAVSAFTNACSRLALAEESVEQARLALGAENERFAEGDGSSRNVLDAQKDLTNATRQKLAVALEVVGGAIELRRASGLPPIGQGDLP